jgi:hypothetical protein
MSNKRVPRLPARLERLRKASADWGPFAGTFHWENARADAALAWFQGHAQAASQFVVFGKNARGDLHALWNKLVVCLEADRSVDVRASSLDEFLTLLAHEKPVKTPGRSAFVKWLFAEGLAPASDPEALVAKANRDHYQDLSDLVEDVLSGPAPVPVRRTQLPTDPSELLGKTLHRVPRLSKASGVSITRQDDVGPVKSISLRRGTLTKKLRPLGLDLSTLFGCDRTSVVFRLGAFGAPSASGVEWERYDRDGIGLHLEFRPNLEMVTLIWLPSLRV